MFRPVGAFSLAAAKVFIRSFAPFMRPETAAEDGEDRLVLAFLSDDGRPVAVRLHQTAERVVADVREGDSGDGLREQVARILALDIDAESLRAMDPAEALVRLQEIDGIGPFGAELILVRGASAPDVFARNEPLLHRVITHHYGLADPSRADLVAIAERWRPRRSWATFLLRQATPR